MMCSACGAACAPSSRSCPICDTPLASRSGAAVALAARPAGATTRLAPRAPLRHTLRYAPNRAAPADRPLPPGTMLEGRYRVLHVLGAGSFGRVYLAENTLDPNRTRLAIKELRATGWTSAAERSEAEGWFQREVSMLLTLRHPAIPAVHGYWGARHGAGPMYLAMDYIPGPTLDRLLDQRSPLPWRQVVAWGITLCEVLDYLHSLSPAYVFRDLKPANVILDSRTDSPVLIDFGIARCLGNAGGTGIGTWGYVPYEQVLGRAVPASDIYALGATLHALLTGLRPDAEYLRLQRQGHDVETAMRALFPPAHTLEPSIPSLLAEVLIRATAFDQADRFPDARAFATALCQALVPLGAPPPSGIGAPLVGAPTDNRSRDLCQGVLEPLGETRFNSTVASASGAAASCITVAIEGGQFSSIAAAIRHARPGTRIEILPGTYRERLVIDKPLEIVAMGAPNTVIVEAPDAPCLTMRAASAMVSGLTFRCSPCQGHKHGPVVDIRAGRLLLERCQVSSGAGACILVHGNTADPLIRHCTIEHGGAAGIIFSDMAAGTVEECRISGNAVGIAIRRFAAPTIRRCAISGAASYGVHADHYAEGMVEHCQISDNGQAGVYIDYGSTLAIRDCRINRNERAIAMAANAGGTVEGCDLRGNKLGVWAVTPGGERWLHRLANQE